MAGLNTLLGIGQSALYSTQTAISTTGNNIANLNTEGYSRQIVRFEEIRQQDFRPGMLGQGVRAAEIYRNFNQFLENTYLERYTQQNRWNEQETVMTSVESIFNEANRDGISSAFGAFFNDWNNLNLRPNDTPTRESLLANGQQLAQVLENSRDAMESVQHEMDMYIEDSVNKVNEYIRGITDLNRQIAVYQGTGENPNRLLDQRDLMVRKLSEIIDVDVIEREPDFTILTRAGHTLVKGVESEFSLSFGPERVENHLVKDSAYDGSMRIIGSDSHEYLFEIVEPATAGVPGRMRVSMDGGRTWLRNEDGSQMMIEVPAEANRQVNIKGVGVAFTGDPATLSVGDRFEVVPKSALYWHSPTREPLNITPQVLADGTDNTNRVTGGKLATYFNVRDHHVGRYLDRIDALSNALIWEVNAIHSQGANKTFTHIIASNQVADATVNLGSTTSGLDYFNELTTGNLSFQIYDNNGKPLRDPGTDALIPPRPLDFDGNDANGITPFDPSTHTLKNLVDAINRDYAGYIQADVLDGRLQLQSVGDYSFAVASDTTGLLAALGVNTFFQGSSSRDIAVATALVQDVNYINASKVNANGDIDAGDNITASKLYQLGSRTVRISTLWDTNNQSFSAYYSTTVAMVGSETRTAKFNSQYNTALAEDLNEQTAAVSAVNLDEEMTALIKFQHSYTAAAKLITTADQMLQTLLSLKQ